MSGEWSSTIFRLVSVRGDGGGLEHNGRKSLFERSEFLIDTSQKKSLRVCTCARVK